MLNQNFIIFAALYVASAVCHGLMARKFNKDSKLSAIARAFLAITIGTLPLAIVIGVFTGFEVTDWPKILPLLSISAVCAALFHTLTMYTLKHMTASRWQVLNGSYVLFAALLAFALGESLAVLAVAGVAIVTAGLIATTYSKESLKSSSRKNDALVLLAALAVAAALVLQSKATSYGSSGAILVIVITLQAVALGITALPSIVGAKNPNINKNTVLRFGLLGVLNALIGLFYLLAQTNTASIAMLTTVTSLSVPITALAAIIIFKEHNNIYLKLLGLLLVFTGVMLFGLG